MISNLLSFLRSKRVRRPYLEFSFFLFQEQKKRRAITPASDHRVRFATLFVTSPALQIRLQCNVHTLPGRCSSRSIAANALSSHARSPRAHRCPFRYPHSRVPCDLRGLPPAHVAEPDPHLVAELELAWGGVDAVWEISVNWAGVTS